MSDLSPARASHPADIGGSLRLLALIAVIIGVLGLADAALVLSYAGIHAIALTAGVSKTLARLYPLIFDAMLIVASAAVLSLRGAGLLMRCYAWLSMLLLLCAAAGADALHATAIRLPHRTSAATVAIIPWALVLLGFGLLLAMLRHARQRRARAAQALAGAAAATGTLTTGMQAPRVQAAIGARTDLGARPSPPAGRHGGTDLAAATRTDALLPPETDAPATGQPGPATPSWPSGPDTPDVPGTSGPVGMSRHGDSQAAELALDAEPGNDDPTSDEAHSARHAPARWVPRARGEMQPDDSRYTGDYPAPVMSPAPVAEIIDDRAAAQQRARHAAPDPEQGAETPRAPSTRPGPDRDGEARLEHEADDQPSAEAEAEAGLVYEGESGAVAELRAAARQPDIEDGPEAAVLPGADDEPRAEDGPGMAAAAGPHDEPGADDEPRAEDGPGMAAAAGPRDGPGADDEPRAEDGPGMAAATGDRKSTRL